MALFRKGILSAIADSITIAAQISAAKDREDLLLTTAETMVAVGELSADENMLKGVQVSTKLVEVIKEVNKML